MQLKGKVALITGAGSGIGQAAAILLSQQGANVGLLGRTEDELKETQARCDSDTVILLADISVADDMERAITQLVERWGRLDIVFANAGINGVWAPIDEITPDEWDTTINVNLRGTYLTMHYSVPHLKKQGGAVVITASVNGTRIFSNTGATAYSCTKAAQVAFAKMTALELAPHKIRVNVVCPGAIETEIDDNTKKRDIDEIKTPVEFPEGKIPLTGGKPGTSEDVAQLVLFLASDASRHITGTELWIDGAESLVVG